MKTSIYIKLARYFICLILITCLTSSTLFFITLGRPMAKEAHQLIRNHVAFIARQTATILGQEDSREDLEEFISFVGESYGITLVLFDSGLNRVAGFPGNGPGRAEIRPEMLREIDLTGRFVQSGHFSRSTVYLVPLTGGDSRQYYLHLDRPSSTLTPLLLFLGGLSLMCLLLILAIYPLARTFTRPIQRLSRGLELMAAGNFMDTDSGPGQGDELGRLEQTFKKMAGSVTEMMESKKRLLADISHELRSPLGRMEVSAELLSEICQEAGVSEGERHVSMMAHEIRFMTGLVKALSQYSKINLPEFRLDRGLIFPGELAADIFSRNQAIMEKQGLIFRLDLEKDLPRISLDRERILMVLQNFLDNARQYCPAGGEIILGADKKKGEIRLFVSDSGDGIPAESHDKIFDPLFRADTSRNRHTGGLGLGLAISRQIVLLHGGRIRYSRENARTVFRVELAITP